MVPTGGTAGPRCRTCRAVRWRPGAFGGGGRGSELVRTARHRRCRGDRRIRRACGGRRGEPDPGAGRAGAARGHRPAHRRQHRAGAGRGSSDPARGVGAGRGGGRRCRDPAGAAGSGGRCQGRRSARGARKLDLVRDLGADAVADYSDPDWAERVREATGGAGPDVVFDGVGGEIGQAAFEVAADGGRFSVHGASSGEVTVIDPAQARRRGVEVIGIEQLFGFGPKMRGWAERVMSEAAAGRIRPIIGQTFPWSAPRTRTPRSSRAVPWARPCS
ncbi:zinc-binding dehydrogenase [Streptosporangium lutulentum]